jgi:hypothetical protein
MEQKAALGQQDKESKKKRPKRGQVYILCLIGAVVFLLGAWVVSMMTGGIEIEDPNVEPSTEEHRPAPGSIQEVDDPKPAGLTRKEGFYNFLLVGTDKGGGNTDTILLVSFDTKASAINILQIPRDTLLNVDRPVKKIKTLLRLREDRGAQKGFHRSFGGARRPLRHFEHHRLSQGGGRGGRRGGHGARTGHVTIPTPTRTSPST